MDKTGDGLLRQIAIRRASTTSSVRRRTLKLSSALIGVIQDMHLDNTHKGREVFSKIKALLKKKAARTKEALLETIAEALRAVTLKDAEGCFAHCGYGTEAQCL